MVAPFSRSPGNFSPVSFSNSASQFSIFRRKNCGFLTTASTVLTDNSDSEFASFCAHLHRKFSVNTLIIWLGLITSDVKMFRSEISNSDLLSAFQKCLRIL